MTQETEEIPGINDGTEIRALLERALQNHQDRCAHPFDGVLGVPPNWFPNRDTAEFFRLRNALLDTTYHDAFVAPKLALCWLDEWDEMHSDGAGVYTFTVPIEFTEIISKLANYRYVAALDSKRGLEYLGGQHAVRGSEILSAARRGHEAVHGTRGEKIERWNKWMAECLDLARKYPSWNLRQIRTKVAKANRVTQKTIERHTPSLREEICKLK